MSVTRGISIIFHDDSTPSIHSLCSHVIQEVGGGPASVFEWTDLWDPENPLRNSLKVGKLAVSGLGDFHMKLVKSPDPDSEYLPIILDRFPSIRNDPNLMVPLIIPVHLSGCPEPKFYIHVTEWVVAEGTLAQFLIREWSCNSHITIKGCVYKFGQFLRGFHSRYPGLQHTDMNPSNVLIVTDASGISRFVLADCAGLDDQVGNDFQTFVAALHVLAQGGFGEDFAALTISAFTEGYSNP